MMSVSILRLIIASGPLIESTTDNSCKVVAVSFCLSVAGSDSDVTSAAGGRSLRRAGRVGVFRPPPLKGLHVIHVNQLPHNHIRLSGKKNVGVDTLF